MQLGEWTACDRYIADHLIGADEAQAATLAANAAANLPQIDVSAPQGKLLYLLARTLQPKRILEIGTLGGYSTIWLARALAPGGRLVTLEIERKHAELAAANISREGHGADVDIRLGPALELLPGLEAEGFCPVDIAFIDADKENNAHYFRWAVKLARKGSLIIVDNVIRGGAVIDASNNDPMIVGTRALFDAVAAEPRVSATALQTVGAKGWDGFLLASVN
jgi:predicted O-methyltransferase YrrM